ncbi:MAG: C39 family peptidase [Lachnospiraceae bacterium]|nr:C39 family peptidase [Lachnospiraceae bacterium]
MSDKRKIKALILSVSVLLLIIIVYRFSAGNSKTSDEDGSGRSVASVVKEIAVSVGDFVSDKWTDYQAYRMVKREERARRKAEREAEKEAKYLAQMTSVEYIDSHMEGNTNVVEVKTEEDIDEVVPETTLVTTETGERFLSMVDRGDAPNVAVYRYVRIPSETDGVTFRPVNDVVYAIENVKLYESPLLEGEAIETSDTWQAYTRLGISEDCKYQFLSDDNVVLYADGTLFRRFREDVYLTENITLEEERVELPVKYISQNPTLPNGCEVTSLATVLNYLGFDISKEKLSDDYLPKAPVGQANFFEEFVGDPRNGNAYGCYAPVIVETANRYLSDAGSDLRAYDRTGSSFQDLMLKIRAGKPVIVWATSYINQDPEFTIQWVVDGEYLAWKGNLHCMVLIGYDTFNGKAIVSDPMRGIKEYDLELFIKRFKQFYSQAIVIE